MRQSGLPAKEHDDVTDLHNDLSRDAIRKLGRQFLFLIFEVIEFHFHQFVMREGVVSGFEECRTQPVLADLQHRLEQLGAGLEIPKFAIGECFSHARSIMKWCGAPNVLRATITS